MFNLADQAAEHSDEPVEDVPKKTEEIVLSAPRVYKKPVFTVENPQFTYISLDKALQWCGDNSTHAKQCLVVLAVMTILNSFLTMGWPLYFDGNEYKCPTGTGDYVTCDIKRACKEFDQGSIIITGARTITQEFRLICKNGKLF